MKFSRIASASAAIAAASAQQVEFGQCGGENWTGPTTCVAGNVCVFQNDFYSQCLQGTASSGTTTVAPTTTLATSTRTSSTVVTAPTTPVAPGSFVKTSGRVFVIDGEETYFAGTNSYWIPFLTDNADVDLVMGHLQTTGLKVLRVWGFNDVNALPGGDTVWFQSFIEGQQPVINTGATGLERLDYVVSSAEAHGIKLIINFVNNWTDFGGQQAYLNYYGGTATDAWYTTPAIQAQYQTYIEAVISRYKNSTAVFAWELCNEPRCTGCDTSVITEWATTTSAYIKSLDSNHLVTIGDEGFGLPGGAEFDYPYTNGPGLNFTVNLQIPDIDLGTMHLYPSSWGEVDTWGPSWILNHDAIGEAIGKPVILEEFGSLTLTDEIPWQQTVVDSNIAGDLYWQFGDDLSTGETNNDGYAIYWGTPTYDEIVVPHAEAMNAKVA